MGQAELKIYFEILELSPEASLHDIHAAYLRLKKIYGAESPALAPHAEEFPESRRQAVLAQVDLAYARILAAKKTESSRPSPLFSDIPPSQKSGGTPEAAIRPFSGPALRRIRERAEVELAEISRELKLRVELLKNIEDEKFESLPEPIYLKAHLKNYAAFLGLDPGQVVEDYLQRLETDRKRP
jgi:hypothetical protein